MDTFQMRRPDDFHCHFRGDRRLSVVLWYTLQWFQRAVAMPNDPPILNAEEARQYREQLMQVARINAHPKFEPLMTLMITPETTPEMIWEAKKAGVFAGKIYTPTTTGASTGRVITDFHAIGFRHTLETMQEAGMPALFHGEMSLREDDENTFFEQEVLFLGTFLELAREFSSLKMTLEHITTKEGVNVVGSLGPNVGATITAHHLKLTVNDVIGGKIHPHHFCRPPAKRKSDREALWEAIRSGSPKFFFGSDTAPHFKETKECADGCAGIFTAPVLLPLLATLFERNCGENWPTILERFMSTNGATFYGLPLNEGTITLVKRPFRVEADCSGIVPFLSGQSLPWSVKTD